MYFFSVPPINSQPSNMPLERHSTLCCTLLNTLYYIYIYSYDYLSISKILEPEIVKWNFSQNLDIAWVPDLVFS